MASYTAESSLWCCNVRPDGRRIVAGDTVGHVHILELAGTLAPDRTGSSLP